MKPFRVHLETPQTIEQLEAFKDDLEFLSQFSPMDKQELKEWLEWVVPALSLVYSKKGGFLFGCFALQLHKRTAEIHGIFRQDLRAYKELKNIGGEIGRSIIKDAFITHKKKVIITKVPIGSKPVRGFLIRNKFRPLQRDGDYMVYKLTRETYLNG